jgi:hypothetical protein
MKRFFDKKALYFKELPASKVSQQPKRLLWRKWVLLALLSLCWSGLPVVYQEFGGGHEIPPAIAKSGVEWFIHGRQNPEAIPAACVQEKTP